MGPEELSVVSPNALRKFQQFACCDQKWGIYTVTHGTKRKNQRFFVLIADGSGPFFGGEMIESDKRTESGSGWKARSYIWT